MLAQEAVALDDQEVLSPEADDFTITRDMTFLRDATLTSQINNGDQSWDKPDPAPNKESNLHELSM